MRVIKPNWVEHAAGEKQTKSPIYSISVHPDGTRLATGGQDNKVKIWSTLPILDEEAQNNEANHRLLCTMSAHTGPVLTVRWAHHGRYLASGSDDSVLLIWDLDSGGGGRVFGSEEVNVENWKALRRVVGHVADVVDCAWSRDDSMLASVGLDSKIIIWDGFTFERLRTIDAHQGFVKGVTWDPVGNYLATQSDDKTVRIWNTENWQCVQTVSEPFAMSPQSTFFRRLSWSPDGAFIAASNAMNGPVFVAAVIEREGWSSEISFVGHENTIQVAAFNPRLFFSEDRPKDRINASCMVALGADDYNISIWRNTYHKPLVVLRDVFARQLLDLCWANDGLTLYGCSADGTIMAVRFTKEEFPELAAPEMTDKILNDYGYKGRKNRPVVAPRMLDVSTSFASAKGTEEHVNVIVPRKGKKAGPRRVMLDRSGPNGSTSSAPSGGGRPPLQRPAPPSPKRNDPFAGELQPLSQNSRSATDDMRSAITRNNRNDPFANAELQPMNSRSAADDMRFDLKRKAMDDDYSRPTIGRNMGPSRAAAPVAEIRAPRVLLSMSTGAGSGNILAVPSIQSVLRVSSDDNVHILTAENATDNGYNSVSLANNKEGTNLWIDFVPSPVLAIATTPQLSAVACEDGTVRVYAPSGRNTHSVTFSAPVSELVACKEFLLILTADCMVRVIDTRRSKTTISAYSVSHLLNAPQGSSTAATVSDVTIRPNGCPVIITSTPEAWAYDNELEGWTKIACAWWGNSPLNDHQRTRGSRSPSHLGPLSEIEHRIANLCDGDDHRQRPQWWKEAMSASHYETRLRASRLLDSKDEYKHWLREYSKFLGEENFRGRAEELITELMGPVYQHSGSTFWEPTLLGTSKREFAIQALNSMKSTVALGQFAQHHLGILKGIQTDEAKWA